MSPDSSGPFSRGLSFRGNVLWGVVAVRIALPPRYNERPARARTLVFLIR
jgi:hypothetical protein